MIATAMSADRFWQIIERAAQSDHDPDAHEEALRTALLELSLEEIISFELAFRRYLNDAYTWDLWGAAYVIHGGCSDDSFEYFRRWLLRGDATSMRLRWPIPTAWRSWTCDPAPMGCGNSR
jgi:hypothetical protein